MWNINVNDKRFLAVVGLVLYMGFWANSWFDLLVYDRNEFIRFACEHPYIYYCDTLNNLIYHCNEGKEYSKAILRFDELNCTDTGYSWDEWWWNFDPKQ